MAYATLADVRGLGVTVSQMSDDAVNDLLDEVSIDIDRYTGWFFDPRVLTVTMDGRGTPSLEPPYVPIVVDSIVHEGDGISLDSEDLYIHGGPVDPSTFLAPRLTRLTGDSRLRTGCAAGSGTRWIKGNANVVIDGTWGYTIEDPGGDPLGRTPPAIKRACLMMFFRLRSTDITDPFSIIEGSPWRVSEMRTRDQHVVFNDKHSNAMFAKTGGAGPFTGDPTIDEILLRYARPHGLGSV
jgi:hypothetical protein